MKFFNKIFKKFLAWIFLPALFILISVIVILKASYFKISQFSYEGLKTINQDEVDEFIKSELSDSNNTTFWSQDNYFLFNTQNLEDKLNKKFPSAFSKVQTHFPHTLTIQMEEKDSTVIYFNGTQYYLLDHNGSPIKPVTIMVNQNTTSSTIVTSTTSSTLKSLTTSTQPLAEIATGEKLGKEFENLPLIYDKRALEVRGRIITPDLIKSVIKWKELLEKQKLGPVKYFTFENPDSGLELFINQPWKIMFSPNHDLFNQLSNLKLVLKDNKPSEYIDLRYEGRVFWK